MPVSSYNITPALNTTISGIDISEGSPAAGYNDALRQIMADIRAWTDAYAVTYPISIANGGTGATSAATGLAALGGLSVTYKELPQSAKSTGFTLDLTQSAGHIYYTGGAATVLVPANASVAFAIGTAIMLVNDGSGALTLSRDTGVALKWAANNVDANRTLATGGMATLIKVASDLWFISGMGLS